MLRLKPSLGKTKTHTSYKSYASLQICIHAAEAFMQKVDADATTYPLVVAASAYVQMQLTLQTIVNINVQDNLTVTTNSSYCALSEHLCQRLQKRTKKIKYRFVVS